MTLQINSLLKNRYRIEKVLSKGGMGAIYSAFDESLSVKVAVKENLFTTDDATRQFRREATILASLRHNNLPRVTDHFIIPDQGQYLVMDFIEGEDLKERLQRTGILPEEEIMFIGSVICNALSYLHTRKPAIVHRDIKPGNIKITPAGEVFLVDFGIAKISTPGQETTIGAQSLTPGFAPPEQYGQGTDGRTDIYSLAATLYMGLTGIVPANGLARLMNQETLKPIREINPKVSENLARTLEKALEIKKEDRFQTAEEFTQQLLSAQLSDGTKKSQAAALRLEPAPTVSTSRSGKVPGQEAVDVAASKEPSKEVHAQPKRKKVPILLVAGVPVLLICLIALIILVVSGKIPGIALAQKASSTPTPQVQNPTITSEPTLEATDEPSPTKPLDTATLQLPTDTQAPSDTPTQEMTSTPAATPSGGGAGQIAFVSDRSGKPQIYLVNIDGSNLLQITNEMDGACQPDWSPDGEKIVFVSPCRINTVINPSTEAYKGSTIYIINADGTGRNPLASIPGGDFDPAWSPDGSQIAFTSFRDNLTSTDLNLFLYDLESTSVTAVTHDLNYDRRPAWSPDGKSLVFQRQPQGGSILINVINLENGNIYIFSDQTLTNAFMPAWGPGGAIVYSQGSPFPTPHLRPLTPRNAAETVLSDQPAWDMDYSPDGYWLVFERVIFLGDNTRNHDIFIMPSIGGTALQITNDPSRDYQPAWRPSP